MKEVELMKLNHRHSGASLSMRTGDFSAIHRGTAGLDGPGIGSAVEGFLFAASWSWQADPAIELLAVHLNARVLLWDGQRNLARSRVRKNTSATLLLADFRKLLTLEDLARFESVVQEHEGMSFGKVYKLILVAPQAYQRLADAVLTLGYPSRNHFIMSDFSSRLSADPDTEIHGAISRIARLEGRAVNLVSEEMTHLLETTDWRFGTLELDLFLRECIRKMPHPPILTADHLPDWFKAQPERLPGNRDRLVERVFADLGIALLKKNHLS